MNELSKKLKTLPLKPGVYFFKNAAGEVIYVGKAKKLRNRVQSYFRGQAAEIKTPNPSVLTLPASRFSKPSNFSSVYFSFAPTKKLMPSLVSNITSGAVQGYASGR